MRLAVRMLFFLAVLGFSSVSPADEADLRGFVLGASCLNCHAPVGVADARIPSLDGRDSDAIVQALRGFADGSLPGTIMPRLARGFTAEEMQRIAAWLGRRETP